MTPDAPAPERTWLMRCGRAVESVTGYPVAVMFVLRLGERAEDVRDPGFGLPWWVVTNCGSRVRPGSAVGAVAVTGVLVRVLCDAAAVELRPAQYPWRVDLVDALPRAATGKVRRAELRAGDGGKEPREVADEQAG